MLKVETSTCAVHQWHIELFLEYVFFKKSLHRATDATFVPKYAKEDMIRSGHLQYDTLYASNEQQVAQVPGSLFGLTSYLVVTDGRHDGEPDQCP